MKKFIISADVLLAVANTNKDENQKLIQGLKAALTRGDQVLIYHKNNNKETENKLNTLLNNIAGIESLKAISGNENSFQLKTYDSEAELEKLVSDYVPLDSLVDSDQNLIIIGQQEDDKIVNKTINSLIKDQTDLKKLSYAIDSYANMQPAIGANIAATSSHVIALLENEGTFAQDYDKVQSVVENDQTINEVAQFKSIDMPPLRLDQDLNPIYVRANVVDPDSLNMNTEELHTLLSTITNDDKLFPTIILSDNPEIKETFGAEENVFVLSGNKKDALDRFPAEIDNTGMAKIESLNVITNDSQVAGRAHEKYLSAVTSVSIGDPNNTGSENLQLQPDYESNVVFNDIQALTTFIAEAIDDNSQSQPNNVTSSSLKGTIPVGNFAHEALREKKLDKISADLELMGNAMGLDQKVSKAFVAKFIESYKKYNTLVGERPSAERSNLTESVFDYIAIGASLMNGMSGLLKGLLPNTAGVAFVGESGSASIKVSANLLNLYAKLKKFESKGLSVLLKDYNRTLGRLMQSPSDKKEANSIALVEVFMLKSNLTKFSGIASAKSTNDGMKAAMWNVMAAIGSVSTSIVSAVKSNDLGLEKASQIAALGSISSRAVNIYSSLSLFAQDVRIREFLQSIKNNTDRTISDEELNIRLSELIKSPEIKELISEFDKLRTESTSPSIEILDENENTEDDIELANLPVLGDLEDPIITQSILAPYELEVDPDHIRNGTLLAISDVLWDHMEGASKESLQKLLESNKTIQVKIITDEEETAAVIIGEDADLLDRFSVGNWESAHLDKEGNTPKTLVYYGMDGDHSTSEVSKWFQQISQKEELGIRATSVKFSETPKTTEIAHHDFTEFLGYLPETLTNEYFDQLSTEQKLGSEFIYSETLVLPHPSKVPSRPEFTDRITILDADNYEIGVDDLSLILEGFNERRLEHSTKDHYLVVSENPELQKVVESFNDIEKQHVHLLRQREGVLDNYKDLLPLKKITRIGSVSLFTNDKPLTNQAYSNLFGIVNVHTTNKNTNNRAQVVTSVKDLVALLSTDKRQKETLDKFLSKKKPIDLHAIGVKTKIDSLVKMMKVYYGSEQLGKKIFKFRDQNVSFYDYMKALKKEITASPTQINQLTDRFLLIVAALIVLKQPRLDILPTLVGIMGSPKSVYFNNYLKTGKMKSKANKLLSQVFSSAMVAALKHYPEKSYQYCAQMAIAQVMVQKPQTELMMANGEVNRAKSKKFTERTAWAGFFAGGLGTFVPFGILNSKKKEIEGARRLLSATVSKAGEIISSPQAMGMAAMAMNSSQETTNDLQDESELQKLTTNLGRITGMVIFGTVAVTVVGNYVQARYFNQKFKDQGRQMDKLDENLSKNKNQFSKSVPEFLPLVRKRVLSTIVNLLDNVIKGEFTSATKLDQLSQLSKIGVQPKLEQQIKDLKEVLSNSKEVLNVVDAEELIQLNESTTELITGGDFNQNMNSEIEQTNLILEDILANLQNQDSPDSSLTNSLETKKAYFESLNLEDQENLWMSTENGKTEIPNLGENLEPASALFGLDSDISSLQEEGEYQEVTPLFSRMATAQSILSGSFDISNSESEEEKTEIAYQSENLEPIQFISPEESIQEPAGALFASGSEITSFQNEGASQEVPPLLSRMAALPSIQTSTLGRSNSESELKQNKSIAKRSLSL